MIPQHSKLARAMSRVTVILIAAAAVPAFAETDTTAIFVKHLKTSRDFTLKVAGQMPESDFGFKLTPPQMSFAEQMVHIAQGLEYFIAPFSGQKPSPAKPASLKKADVLAFMTKQFDSAIERVSKLTPAQLSKTYTSDEGTMTGLEMLMGMLDHNTHHRASAEMYLRSKGITPAEYQF
jgi:uncharacterized damage-inducible protein DinB